MAKKIANTDIGQETETGQEKPRLGWRVLSPVKVDGVRFEPGAVIELVDEVAEALAAVGAVEPAQSVHQPGADTPAT